MKKRKKAPNKVLRKQAKLAVWLNILLNIKLASKYHCMIVNLECCSMCFLQTYVKNFPLSPEAEVLLVEKYATSHPELIINYCTYHSGEEDMHVALIKTQNVHLIEGIFRRQFSWFNFAPRAQITLIEMNDATYFEKISVLFPKIDNQVISTCIELQNVQIFEKLLCFLEQNKQQFDTQQQKRLLLQQNKEMIGCYLKHRKFSESLETKIIEQNDLTTFSTLIERHKLSTGAEVTLAKSCNKKMLALYVQNWPLVPEAQIELIKKDYKDILKLHFLRHSISEQALLYLLGLTNLKAYLEL